MPLFKRVLIANRGEIACRIARTCQSLGIEFVAVFSDADRNSPHLVGATEVVHLGDSTASNSYLNIEKVVSAACQTGCDAVHPGYGFLSENPAFAQAVQDVGLVFIGPSVQTIEKMGDKAQAKALMRAAGVPLVPGSDEASEDLDTLGRLAKVAGYPVLLKPVAGGGGKGMMVVKSPEDLAAAAQSAMRVARTSFGDARLLVERYIARPRHIEVQVFGDHFGNVVHLYERECSLQRRHQKIVEEAPAVNLDESVLGALRAAAVAGAKAIGYRNAGTFEFIVAPSGEFFFLEVNTRLQVEHPVTEMITGIDLVHWQMLVASDHPLPLEQSQISVRGHAIECRVYAENPLADFAPSPGRLKAVVWPDVRVDGGVVAGSQVSPYYDPMVAKLVVHGAHRTEALDRMRTALSETVLLGLTTNLNFLSRLLERDDVGQARMHTHLVDEELSSLIAPRDNDLALACAAAFSLAQSRDQHAGLDLMSTKLGASWLLDRLALDAAAPMGRLCVYEAGSRMQEALLISSSTEGDLVEVAGKRWLVSFQRWRAGCALGKVGVQGVWVAQFTDIGIEVQLNGDSYSFVVARSADLSDVAEENALVATMPGVVVALHVEMGSVVSKGDPLAVVEAMKMENTLLATRSGVVSSLRVAVGDRIDQGFVLLQIEEQLGEVSGAIEPVSELKP